MNRDRIEKALRQIEETHKGEFSHPVREAVRHIRREMSGSDVQPGEVPLFKSTEQMVSCVAPDIFWKLEPPPEGSSIRVIMAGRDMVGANGEAEVGEILFAGGAYSVLGREDLGAFNYENDAIAALAKVLRTENKGKWSPHRDLMSHSGDASYKSFPALYCPTCEIRLRRVGPWGTEWRCDKCQSDFIAENWREGVVRPLNEDFVTKATALGLSAEQAKLIFDLVKGKK